MPGNIDDIVGPKGKIGILVLSEPAIEVLSLLVSALRHSKDPEVMKKDDTDTREVLAALTISGYAVLPQGTIEAIKRLLTQSEKGKTMYVGEIEKKENSP